MIRLTFATKKVMTRAVLSYGTAFILYKVVLALKSMDKIHMFVHTNLCSIFIYLMWQNKIRKYSFSLALLMKS